MLPNFSKKKGEPKKEEKKGNKNVRLDTESGHPFVDKKQVNKGKHKKEEDEEKPQKTHKIERFATSTGKADESAVTIMKTAKTTLYIKEVVKLLWEIKERVES